MTHSRPTVRELLTSRGLAPRRDLGQNFVADPNTVRRIAHLAGVGPGDRVVEIGAGLGSLTLALAETGAAVTAVEVDHGLVGALRDVVADVPAVDVVEADAMALDWDALLGGHTGWVLVANLPYNVATPLVCDLLDGVPAIERMLVMVQREVGERLAATAGSPAYGAVSVKVAYWATLADRRRRAGVGLRAPSQRRVGARRDRPSPATRRRPGCRVPARADRVRAAPQDAPPLAGGGRDRRSSSPPPASPRPLARRSWRSTTGSGWPAWSARRDRRCASPRPPS